MITRARLYRVSNAFYRAVTIFQKRFEHQPQHLDPSLINGISLWSHLVLQNLYIALADPDYRFPRLDLQHLYVGLPLAPNFTHVAPPRFHKDTLEFYSQRYFSHHRDLIHQTLEWQHSHPTDDHTPITSQLDCLTELECYLQKIDAKINELTSFKTFDDYRHSGEDPPYYQHFIEHHRRLTLGYYHEIINEHRLDTILDDQQKLTLEEEKEALLIVKAAYTTNHTRRIYLPLFATDHPRNCYDNASDPSPKQAS